MSSSALPGNRSRTSTQAMIVPITMLTAVTTSELTTVSLRALAVCSFCSASRKVPQPFSPAVATTAQSGISTRRLNQIIMMPRPRPAPLVRLCREADRRTRVGRPPATLAVAVDMVRLLPGLGLDLGQDPQRVPALTVAEVLPVGVGPACEVTVDGEQVRRRRVRVARLVGTVDLEVADVDERAVAGLRVQLLALGALLEGQEVLGRLRCTVDDRARVLDEEGLVRDHVVKVLAALAGEDRLVLVGEEHVTGAAGERRRGVATAVGQRGDVAEERLHVLLGGLVAATRVLRRAVRREEVPLGRAGGGRVRRHDADAVLDEVVPAVDALGVALLDHEDDDRVGADALGVVVLPVLGHQALVDQTGHVRLQREVDLVGLGAGHDGTRLVTGGAVGLLEVDVLAGVRVLERRDHALVGLLEHRVTHQIERRLVGRALGVTAAPGQGQHPGDRQRRRNPDRPVHSHLVSLRTLCRARTRPCSLITSRLLDLGALIANGHDVARVTHPTAETDGVRRRAALGLGKWVGHL